MKQKSWKINILVLLITIILLFVIAEIGTRVYYSQTDQFIGVDEKEQCDRAAYAKTLKEDDPRRWNSGNSPYLMYAKHTGIIPKPHYIASSERPKTFKNGSKVIVRTTVLVTNRQQMRGTYDVNITPKEKQRVALLGDSFTWGADVSSKQSFGGILERLLPEMEILNFGIEGIGIDTMYLRWKFEAQKYDPDIVLMVIFIDDIRRAQQCIHKPELIPVNGKLKITNIPPPTYEEIFNTYKEPVIESYFIKHLQYTLNYKEGVSKVQYEYGFTILDPMLDEMKEKIESNNGSFMILIIEHGNDGINSEVELDAIKKLRTLLWEKRIPFTSTNDIFERENYDPVDYTKTKTAGHFVPLGYGLIAEGITSLFSREKVIVPLPDYVIVQDRKTEMLILVNTENSSQNIEIPAYKLI